METDVIGCSWASFSFVVTGNSLWLATEPTVIASGSASSGESLCLVTETSVTVCSSQGAGDGSL